MNVENKIIKLLGDNAIYGEYSISFDTNITLEEQIELRIKLSGNILANPAFTYCDLQSKALKYTSNYELYGALFFLGIVLSLIFSFATVLIINYKQITEGYEDQNQFIRMKKSWYNR